MTSLNQFCKKGFLTLLATGFLFVVFQSCSSSKNSGQTNTATAEALGNRQFEFIPNFMQPMGSRQRSITGNYYVRVDKNKVEVDLPYIGRATQVSPGSLDQGMKFVSTDFTYNSQVGKKGQNEIVIEPKDQSNIQTLRITAFSNGSSTVQINSANKSAITYSGEIRAKKP